MYYEDPDGNQAELQVDLMDSSDALAFMESDTFAGNPLGVTFDPEQMAIEHAAGQPLTAVSVYGPES